MSGWDFLLPSFDNLGAVKDNQPAMLLYPSFLDLLLSFSASISSAMYQKQSGMELEEINLS